MTTLQSAHSTSLRPSPARPSPPSLTSLALCLAYFAYCTPPPHRRGQLLRRADALRLAAWLGSPAPAPPARDAHLALHLIWLTAAGLLIGDTRGLRLAATAAYRLREPAERLCAALLAAAQPAAWAAAAGRLGLAEAVPDAYRLFAQQSLLRQAAQPTAAPLAAWQDAGPTCWQLLLRPGGDPAALFDLLALGDYAPPGCLTLSPLTLGAPPARALGFDQVRWLLETATGAPLDPPRRAQLRHWLGRAGAYRLRGPLLSTAQPEQLAALYAAAGLRPYLLEQIGPRHVLFDRAGLPVLRRRLAALGYPLQATPPTGDAAAPAPDADLLWLGLRVLDGLKRAVPAPGLLPHAALDRLAAALPADRLAELDALADRLLGDLQAVIQGRDAFFPARDAPPAALLAHLRAAIAGERTLDVDYCPPGGGEPRRHTIEPLRLEERDRLAYLTAYSRRAEATLTFRLDRLRTDIEYTDS